MIGFILLVACASNKNKKQSGLEYDDEKNIDVPAWVYSINDECDNKKYLCASAEGSSSLEADLNAKKALASILEVRVTSKSEIKKFGLTSLESKGLTEKVSFDLKEEVDVLLKGAKITNRFKKGDAYYSLAVLEKAPAIKVLKIKLKKVDDKLSSLIKLNKKTYVNRLLVLLTERNAIYSELAILGAKASRAPVSFSQIYALKNSSSEQELVKVEVVGENPMPSNLASKIEEELTSLGYKITNKNFFSVVKMDYKKEEEYLKVKGFKKYSFILNLKSFARDGKKLGVISVKEIVTGRSESDALRSALNRVILKIKNNIEKLNI